MLGSSRIVASNIVVLFLVKLVYITEMVMFTQLKSLSVNVQLAVQFIL